MKFDLSYNNNNEPFLVEGSYNNSAVSVNVLALPSEFNSALTAGLGNIQTQIDNINNVLSTGVSFKGVFTNTTGSMLPTPTAAGWMYTYTGMTSYTLVSASSISGEETLRKGDAVISVYDGTSYLWAAIDNNTDIATASTPGLVTAGTTSGTTMGVDIDNSGAMTVTHYTPSGIAYNLSPAGELSLTSDSSFVITGLSYSADENGHITSIVANKGKLPPAKVRVQPASGNTNYPLILKYNANNSGETNYLLFDNNGPASSYFNPSKNILFASYMHSYGMVVNSRDVVSCDVLNSNFGDLSLF